MENFKPYYVTLRHDNGKFTAKVNATSKKNAIETVAKIEGIPTTIALNGLVKVVKA